MGKNKKKKLALKKETVRKLDAVSPAELHKAAGGNYNYNYDYNYQYQPRNGYQGGGASNACIRTTTGTCGCEPTGGC